MDEIEFREILAQGHELSGIEYKSPGSRTDKSFASKVVRACLGMANHKGGGRIFIEVKEKAQLPPEPTGISDADALTWNYDELSATLSEYADPSISFEIEVFPYAGKKFVKITISEFQDIPIICKKDCQEASPKKEMVLRKGACYVRTRRKPETTEIPSQEDMRDLLDLAIEKRLRSFIAQASSAGLLPVSSQKPSDDESFSKQVSDLLG